MKYSRLCLSTVALATTLLAAAPSIATPTATAPPKAARTNPPPRVVKMTITKAEVLAAQKAWGEALVAISRTYRQEGQAAAQALAERVIDEAYGYQLGTVLFKPTLTEAPHTFRTTREGALAYFVGGNPAFPMDQGFALKGWRNVEVQNAGIFITGNVATTMGNVRITDKTGQVTTVDKTWQFMKDDSGRLRIILHHSSLPFVSKR